MTHSLLFKTADEAVAEGERRNIRELHPHRIELVNPLRVVGTEEIITGDDHGWCLIQYEAMIGEPNLLLCSDGVFRPGFLNMETREGKMVL